VAGVVAAAGDVAQDASAALGGLRCVSVLVVAVTSSDEITLGCRRL
jgi:hypothetical protein